MTVEPSIIATAVPAGILVSLFGAVRGRVDELVSMDKQVITSADQPSVPSTGLRPDS